MHAVKLSTVLEHWAWNSQWNSVLELKKSVHLMSSDMFVAVFVLIDFEGHVLQDSSFYFLNLYFSLKKKNLSDFWSIWTDLMCRFSGPYISADCWHKVSNQCYRHCLYLGFFFNCSDGALSSGAYSLSSSNSVHVSPLNRCVLMMFLALFVNLGTRKRESNPMRCVCH